MIVRRETAKCCQSKFSRYGNTGGRPGGRLMRVGERLVALAPATGTPSSTHKSSKAEGAMDQPATARYRKVIAIEAAAAFVERRMVMSSTHQGLSCHAGETAPTSPATGRSVAPRPGPLATASAPDLSDLGGEVARQSTPSTSLAKGFRRRCHRVRHRTISNEARTNARANLEVRKWNSRRAAAAADFNGESNGCGRPDSWSGVRAPGRASTGQTPEEDRFGSRVGFGFKLGLNQTSKAPKAALRIRVFCPHNPGLRPHRSWSSRLRARQFCVPHPDRTDQITIATRALGCDQQTSAPDCLQGTVGVTDSGRPRVVDTTSAPSRSHLAIRVAGDPGHRRFRLERDQPHGIGGHGDARQPRPWR